MLDSNNWGSGYFWSIIWVRSFFYSWLQKAANCHFVFVYTWKAVMTMLFIAYPNKWPHRTKTLLYFYFKWRKYNFFNFISFWTYLKVILYFSYNGLEDMWDLPWWRSIFRVPWLVRKEFPKIQTEGNKICTKCKQTLQRACRYLTRKYVQNTSEKLTIHLSVRTP